MKVAILVSATSTLTHETICTFLQTNSQRLPVVGDLLLHLLDSSLMLGTQELVGLAVGCAIFKGQQWLNLRTMLLRLNPEQLSEVLYGLYPPLQRLYGSQIAGWLCENWNAVDAQTLELLEHL